LDKARAEFLHLSGEPRRWPARVEAKRLLDLAAADSEIIAISDFVETPASRPISNYVVPAYAFTRDGRISQRRSAIHAPWGLHENVKFEIAALEAWRKGRRVAEVAPDVVVAEGPSKQPVDLDQKRDCDLQSGPPERRLASEAELGKAILKIGRMPEKRLQQSLQTELPGKHFSRDLMRKLYNQEFGERCLGRPKKSRGKISRGN
jgi:hypothetical protein